MRTNLKNIQVLLLFLSIHLSMQCVYESDENRIVCNDYTEASNEAKEDWFSLLVFNKNKSFTLEANSFTRMPNLLKLIVSSIENIQDGAFNGLKNLDQLTIYNTKLAQIPNSLYANLSIRNLQINKNLNFAKLPIRYFQNLPNLQIVDLRQNSIQLINDQVFSSTNIIEVYLDRNKIETINNNAFTNMENLSRLSLTDNKLKQFESKRILGTTNSTKVVWLDKNQLTKIDTTFLEGFPALERLYLGANQIADIETGVFKFTPSLILLDISHNQLKRIPANIFPVTGQSDLINLFLHNNKFTFLENTVFYRLPKLKHISFGGNPMQCPCLDTISKFLHNRNINRLCDDIYSSGQRPSCIKSELSTTECIYDTELTENLYEIYKELIASEGYPVLKEKCDITNGVDRAILSDLY